MLLVGDRTGLAQGAPLVLQLSPIVSALDWVVGLSTLVGALHLAITIICRLLTDARACRLTLHRWPPEPCQGVCKLYPGMLLLPLAKLMLLAPCILRCFSLSSLALASRNTTHPLYFGRCFFFFRKLGVFEMPEVHGRCEMNRTSVLLLLLNFF